MPILLELILFTKDDINEVYYERREEKVDTVFC